MYSCSTLSDDPALFFQSPLCCHPCCADGPAPFKWMRTSFLLSPSWDNLITSLRGIFSKFGQLLSQPQKTLLDMYKIFFFFFMIETSTGLQESGVIPAVNGWILWTWQGVLCWFESIFLEQMTERVYMISVSHMLTHQPELLKPGTNCAASSAR